MLCSIHTFSKEQSIKYVKVQAIFKHIRQPFIGQLLCSKNGFRNRSYIYEKDIIPSSYDNVVSAIMSRSDWE